jgi:hypothetical protein
VTDASGSDGLRITERFGIVITTATIGSNGMEAAGRRPHEQHQGFSRRLCLIR